MKFSKCKTCTFFVSSPLKLDFTIKIYLQHFKGLFISKLKISFWGTGKPFWVWSVHFLSQSWCSPLTWKNILIKIKESKPLHNANSPAEEYNPVFRIFPIFFKCIFIRYVQMYLELIFWLILKKFSRLWEKMVKLYLQN